MMWLEGTAPLGWGAYVNDTRTFGYTGFTSIIEVADFGDGQEPAPSLPRSPLPPRPTASHSATDNCPGALAGKALFDGKAGCVGCHSGPLSTNNQTFEEGITHGR